MKQLSFKVVIPARYGSTRLPGKPLIPLLGTPMVVHVLRRALEAQPDEVIVATDDARIVRVVEEAGGTALMTAPDHASGTDRLAEVCALRGYGDDDIIVNLQGDEPLMPAALTRAVAGALADARAADLATLAVRIEDPADVFNLNAVKVVLATDGRALYFSRSPIPWVRGGFTHGQPLERVPVAPPLYRHLGMYAYRVATLRKLSALPATPLESAESLEQLRALEHGMRIQVLVHAGAPPPPGVDTAEDVIAVEAALREQHTPSPA